MVNVIARSGGNPFSGSFRQTLNNDNWLALTPFAADVKADKGLPTYEYTLGGPVLRDRLWFFATGRLQETEEARTLVITNIPYSFTNALRRYEAKATYALSGRHRFQGAYTRSTESQTNQAQNPAIVMDANSLYDARRAMDLFPSITTAS